MRVESGALRSGADRFERVRAAVDPSNMPASFAAPGLDPVSVAVANRLAAKAAETVAQLQGTCAALDAAAQRLRGSAQGYDETESSSTAALSGGTGLGSSLGSGPPVSTPSAPSAAPGPVAAAAPAGTPEQLSAALHGGAGAQSVREFAQQWSTFASALRAAAEDAAGARGAVGQEWDGQAHDAADAVLLSVHEQLEQQAGSAAKLSTWADTHATSFEDAVTPGTGVPQPQQFSAWHQNLENAVAADAQFPGVYTPAVVAAQEELGQGYAQTGQAYGQYAVDPVTGELIDPATGLPIDPATGLPVADASEDAAGVGEGEAEEMLSTGAELLTGLLGGAVGAVGGVVGGITQAGQQAGQMAAQTVGQLAKAAADPGLGDLDDLAGSEFGDLSGSDFGGYGGGGGGGVQPSGGAPGPGVASTGAPAAPGPAATPSMGPSGVRPAESGAGMRGMGGMGMPMMPMGAMGGAAGAQPSQPNPDASPDGKKLVAPKRPNTARVIGESDAQRVESKRQRREQRMAEARESAKEQG